MPAMVTPGRLSIHASGVSINTPVRRSKPIKYNMIKPTGKSNAPTSGDPVCTVTVIANAAANARIAPAIKARIKVSLVDMKILDSPASIIFVTNSEGTK